MELNTKVNANTQIFCLLRGGFKLSYAMVGASVNDHSILVDWGDASDFLLPAVILRKLCRKGPHVKLLAILRDIQTPFSGACSLIGVVEDDSS
jgi:hypothetical protein